MVESFDLIRQGSADCKSFEFRSETRTLNMFRVVLECHRCRRFDMADFISTVGDILFERVECRVNQILFAGFVLFLVKVGPVFEIRVCA